jgi:hypothetical protein
LRLLHRAERKHKAERDAALVLRFESTADIAQRPFLIGEDVREAAHEYDVQRRRLTGQDFCHYSGGARGWFDQLRHGHSFAGRLYIVLFLCQSAYGSKP